MDGYDDSYDDENLTCYGCTNEFYELYTCYNKYCGVSWCENCNLSKETFIFNNTHYCSFCWEGTNFLNIAPKNMYYCWSPKEHICGNTECKDIAVDDFDYEEAGRPARGICCVTRFENNEKNYCSECYKANVNPRIYTWLLIGKTLELPKDIRIMIGKLIWEK
jgi:hypothetical protein